MRNIEYRIKRGVASVLTAILAVATFAVTFVTANFVLPEQEAGAAIGACPPTIVGGICGNNLLQHAAIPGNEAAPNGCLLYTSDAADE